MASPTTQKVIQLLQNGQLDQAYQELSLQLSLSPNDAQLQFLLGEIMLRAGKAQEAMHAYNKTHQLAPNMTAALERLGMLFLQFGKAEQAVQCYEKAMKTAPGTLGIRANYATALLAANQHDKAVDEYFELIRLSPKTSECYFSCLVVLDKMQDHEQLSRLVSLAKASCPDPNITTLCEAMQLWADKQAKDAQQLLESIRFDESQEQIRKEELRVSTLVRVCDRLGEYDTCMQYAEAMNRISLQSAPHTNKDQFLALIQSRMDYFTPEHLAHWQPLPKVASQDSPIFLVGFPRSGTTLLNNMLHGHPDVEVIEEQSMTFKMIAKYAQYHQEMVGLKTLSAEELSSIRSAYFDELEKHRSKGAPLIIDKLPLNLISAGLIARFFPDARFILVLRHPCDCILSGYMNLFELNSSMASFLSLEDSAILYDKTMTLWEQYCDMLNLNVHTIRYEDIVRDRKSVLPSLVDFIGLPWDDALMEHDKTAQSRGHINTPSYNQVNQKIYQHATYRWQRYESYLAPQMTYLQKWIDRWGYNDA